MDKRTPCILVSSDWKTEVGYTASAEIQNKLYWLFDGKIGVLVAGVASAAHALLDTLRQEVKLQGLTESNAQDRLTEAALKHKEKLTITEVRKRHSVTFEHFRMHPEEFDRAQWSDTWSRLIQLEFECQFIVCLFIKKLPFIYQIDADADVWRDENFLTIGNRQ